MTLKRKKKKLTEYFPFHFFLIFQKRNVRNMK